jgi:hypothetical protein
MWCCWIFPGHNSISIQRSPRSGYRGRPSLQRQGTVSIRLMDRTPSKDSYRKT